MSSTKQSIGTGCSREGGPRPTNTRWVQSPPPEDVGQEHQKSCHRHPPPQHKDFYGPPKFVHSTWMAGQTRSKKQLRSPIFSREEVVLDGSRISEILRLSAGELVSYSRNRQQITGARRRANRHRAGSSGRVRGASVGRDRGILRKWRRSPPWW